MVSFFFFGFVFSFEYSRVEPFHNSREKQCYCSKLFLSDKMHCQIEVMDGTILYLNMNYILVMVVKLCDLTVFRKLFTLYCTM